jgi:hypothetical protein
MANVFAPFGANVIGHLYDSGYNARTRAYVIPASDATALYVGDFVKSTGSGALNEAGEMLPAITQAGATDTLLGVVVGFGVNSTYLNQIYRTAYTLRTVYVADDPNIMIEIQASGATVAETMFGGNADIAVGTGSTITGVSGSYINVATVDSASMQLRILGMAQEANNELGVYTRLICYINEHEHKSTTGVHS